MPPSNLANMRVIVGHGTRGSPQGNWFPWLESELKQRGIEVNVPEFPTPDGQSFEQWKQAFAMQVGVLKPTDVMVGHSISAAFFCRLIGQQGVRIRALILVAGFIRQLGLKDYDPLNATFVEPAFDWGNIRTKAQTFFVISGENDPYVPQVYGKELAVALGVPLELIAGGGHLNAEFGFAKFDLMLDRVLSLSATKR